MKKLILLAIYRIRSRTIFLASKKKFLLLGEPYDWAPIILDERFTSRYHLTFETGDQIPPTNVSSNDLMDILEQSVTYSGALIYDLDTQASMLQGAIQYYDRQFELWKKRLMNVEGVLTAVLPFPMHNFIAHLANSMNKPVLVWEHGEHIASDDTMMTMANELQYCTHYLTYGHLVKKRESNYIGKNYLKKVIQVGSTKKNLFRVNHELILYATGKWMFTRIPFGNAIDGDTRLFNAQNDILSYLSKVGEKHKIILKANNTPGFNEIPFKMDNIHIDHFTPFTKYLKQAKVVVLDTPATTLLEAISTDVPIFVLSGRTPWNKETTNLVKKRAVVADTTEELLLYLNKYLENGTYPADVHNKEFLNGYGSIESVDRTHKNVLTVLREVLQNSK